MLDVEVGAARPPKERSGWLQLRCVQPVVTQRRMRTEVVLEVDGPVSTVSAVSDAIELFPRRIGRCCGFLADVAQSAAGNQVASDGCGLWERSVGGAFYLLGRS